MLYRATGSAATSGNHDKEIVVLTADCNDLTSEDRATFKESFEYFVLPFLIPRTISMVESIADMLA